MRGTHWGKGTIGLQVAVPKDPTRDLFNYFYTFISCRTLIHLPTISSVTAILATFMKMAYIAHTCI